MPPCGLRIGGGGGCGCGNESMSLKTEDLAARMPPYTRNSASSTRMIIVPSSNHNSGNLRISVAPMSS